MWSNALFVGSTLSTSGVFSYRCSRNSIFPSPTVWLTILLTTFSKLLLMSLPMKPLSVLSFSPINALPHWLSTPGAMWSILSLSSFIHRVDRSPLYFWAQNILSMLMNKRNFFPRTTVHGCTVATLYDPFFVVYSFLDVASAISDGSFLTSLTRTPFSNTDSFVALLSALFS